MVDYYYPEEEYFNGDFSEYIKILSDCDFAPHDIDDRERFDEVLDYFRQVIQTSPDFIPAYEYTLGMFGCLEPKEGELNSTIEFLDNSRMAASMRVAKKDKIFEMNVEWGWIENRPLIRGVFSNAERLWKEDKRNQANELFGQILKTNENDNIGARYYVKATDEGMSFKEFEKRFVEIDEYGSSFYNQELSKWFGE